MLNVLGEVLGNPFGFVFRYFLTGLDEHIVNIFVSSLMLSILAWPFFWIGKKVYGKGKNTFGKVVKTSILMSIITIIVIGIWTSLFGVNYFAALLSGGIFGALSGFVTLVVMITLMIEFGFKLHYFMEERWEMPKKLHEYLIIFVCCFMFFTLWAMYLLVSSLI